MSFCVQCGSKKIDGAKFCMGCGTEFAEYEPDVEEDPVVEADESEVEANESPEEELEEPVVEADESEVSPESISGEEVSSQEEMIDWSEARIQEDVGSESKSGVDIGTSQGGLWSKKGITLVSGIVIALLIILQFLIPATISILSGGSDEEKTWDTGEPLFVSLETYYPYDDGSIECNLSVDSCSGIGHTYGVMMTVGGGVGPYEIELHHLWSGYSDLLYSHYDVHDLTENDFERVHYHSNFWSHTIYTYELVVVDSTGTTATSDWLQVFIGVRDMDGDGILDDDDNCRLAYNPDQSDYDSDGDGDVCDGDADGDGLTNNEDVYDLGNGGVSVYVTQLTGFTDEDYDEHYSENDGNDGIEAPDFQYTLQVDWNCDQEYDDTYSMVSEGVLYRNLYDVTLSKSDSEVLTSDVPDDQLKICFTMNLYDYDSNSNDRDWLDTRDGDGTSSIWEVNIQAADEKACHCTIVTGTGDGGSSYPAASYEITIETHLV